jgi:HlyD family secretion protein
MRISRRFLLLLAGTAVALVCLAVFTREHHKPSSYNPVEWVKAGKMSFEVRVNTLGELEAARSIIISSELRGNQGKIIYIAENGASVNTGDILVSFDTTPFDDKIRELEAKIKEKESNIEMRKQLLAWENSRTEKEANLAQYTLQTARLDFRQLVEGEGPLELSRLESTMLKAEQEYSEKSKYSEELKKLVEQGYVTQGELDAIGKTIGEKKEAYLSAKRQYESYKNFVLPSLTEKATANIQKAESEIELAMKASASKVGEATAFLRQARQELDSTKIQLEEAMNELGKTVIKAPIPGMVVLYESFRSGEIKSPPRVGDTIWQNQPLLFLPDLSSMLVKTSVREIDLHKIAQDKEALITVDAYPDLRLKGTVQSIGILAERPEGKQRRENYFQVIITVEGNHPQLRPGMTVRVSILCDKVFDVIAVPVHSVFTEKGQEFCYVKTENGFRKQTVTTGLQNEDFAEIKKGLSEAELVSTIKP